MFKPGDVVYIHDSAKEDVSALAWEYVNQHRKCQIVDTFHAGSNANLPESETLYAVVWPESFVGGIDCWRMCMKGCGQFVTQKHLELNFEDSRAVVTVPNIVAP